ncbi:MAG: DUF5615 family PIN-like protein [Candidatus Aminicenantes bacterium]|nr:DUF5615 family PIN-like protein [Candidatus Aminicenantes bacterium]
MKLLFDQNLSPKLVQILSEISPGSIHVQAVNLDRADDSEVWRFARDNNDIIILREDPGSRYFNIHLEIPTV